MAGSDLVQELQLEVTCSICSKYMEVPVTLDCGHNYCQACILQYWARVEEEEEDPKQCPQCRRPFRQRSFRPNKLLANVTAIAKRFPSQDEAQDERPRSIPLGGEEPMGQDPQGQQESFRQRLEILKRDLEIMLSLPCDREMQEHLLHFLQDGQQMTLQKLQEMEGGNGTREEGQEREEPDPEQQDENITLSRSGSEKPSKPSPESPEPFDCQLPLGHSTQGLQMKGYRGEVTMDPITHYSELVLSSGWRNVHLGDESRNVPIYRERVNTDVCVLASERSDSKKPLKAHPELPEPRDCRLPLLHGSQRIQKKDGRVEMTLDPRRAKPELILSRRTEMTLDLKTAYPELVFSRDRRSVRLGDERHKVPNYYERFDTDPCVLASEGFSFGRYSWEVEVGDAGCWAVGVARKSVKRKGPLRLTPEHGFWTVERHMGKYWALSSSPFRVFCEERLLRVGICLDYVAGQVHFHNPETLTHLYTFTTTFMEEIFPFFYTEDKQTPLVITKFETE